MPEVPPEKPYQRPTTEGLRRWRRAQAFGGFALACSFFLPAVRACNSAVIPAEETWDFVTSRSADLIEWPLFFVVYIAPYLFGLLTLLIAFRRPRGSPKQNSRSGTSIAILLGTVIVVCLVGVILTVHEGGAMEIGFAVFSMFVVLSCSYWLRGIRMGAGGQLCLRWYAALSCAVWFSFWIVGGDSMYGLWISFTGSVAILLGCFFEAVVRSRLAKWATVRALITSRLRLYDLDGPRCYACGYLLIGLTTPRCPECGKAFDPDKYDLSRPADISP